MKSLELILRWNMKEMDTEDEEHEVRRLTKEELGIYHQYKEIFIQFRQELKERCLVFGYIHRP